MNAGQSDEEDVRQQARMEITKRKRRRIRATGRMESHNSYRVCELPGADCENVFGPIQRE